MIRNAEDVLDHARWAARRAGKYALAHELDNTLAVVRGDPDKEHEDEIESLTQDHEKEIESLEDSHRDELTNLESDIETLEEENESLRIECDAKSDRIGELEAEISQMLAREGRV